MNNNVIWFLLMIGLAGGIIFFVANNKKEVAPQPAPVIPQPLPPVLPPVQPELPPVQAVRTFEGPWVTIKRRRLNGIMTGIVTNTGQNQWSGKFFGVWEGVRFSYTVPFSGSLDNLQGTATIDGASYQWTGKIIGNNFTGVFTGSRYDGSFDLREK